jgi:hypothetical protein
MSVIRRLERRIDLGLAMALPTLVVTSCLVPLLALALGSARSWLAPVVIGLVAAGACAFLLRNRGVLRASATAMLGVAAGSCLLVMVSWGLNTLGTSQDQSAPNVASAILVAIPVFIVAFGLAALVLALRALPGHRVAVVAAWAVALAAPFALASPIGSLSDRAGNAGMDVIALFVMPLAAVFAWSLLLAVSPSVTTD